MRLITEFNDKVKSKCVINESTKEKNYYIEGIYCQSEVENRNGRIYPKEVLTEAMNTYIADYVKTNRAFSELNHPEHPQVNLERACALIKELHASGNDYVGKAIVLDTPMGNIVKGILAGGGQVGVSTRALGDIDTRNGVDYVQPGLVVSAIDVVADPSAPKAFVNGIMESCEWFKQGDRFIKQTSRAKKEINEAIRLTKIKEKREKMFLESFERFINSIQYK